jgi:hypothetical protein
MTASCPWKASKNRPIINSFSHLAVPAFSEGDLAWICAARGKYARRGAASVTYPGQISWEYDRTCRVSRYHARKEAPLEKPDPGGLPGGPVAKSACLISDERAAVAVCEHAPSTERPSLPCGRARLRAPRYATLVPPKGRSASIDPQPWQRTAGRWL